MDLWRFRGGVRNYLFIALVFVRVPWKSNKIKKKGEMKKKVFKEKLTEGAELHHEMGIEGAETGEDIYKLGKMTLNLCQTHLSVFVVILKTSQHLVGGLKGLKRWQKGNDTNESDGASTRLQSVYSSQHSHRSIKRVKREFSYSTINSE